MSLTHFPHGVSSFGVPMIADMFLGKVWGNSYFVDGTLGSDSNAGTDRDVPFKTIQKGINSMAAGDILHVKDGAYAETLTCAKSRVQIIGESMSGVVVTGATDATDTFTISGNEVTVANMSFRPYDTGDDISLIKTTGDGTRIQHCDFSSGELQIENIDGDYCYIIGCHFITPHDTTDGACIHLEDANECKVLFCSFFVDANSDAIIHHDADNLEVGWCIAVGDDDTSASAGAFVLIAGADATSELMVHDCQVTLFGAVIAEVSTAVAAHGLGTGDLATTATVDSMEVDNLYFNNDGLGCTVFFDTTGLT